MFPHFQLLAPQKFLKLLQGESSIHFDSISDILTFQVCFLASKKNKKTFVFRSYEPSHIQPQTFNLI